MKHTLGQNTMPTTVEFTHYFGEDNCLLVTAEVTPGKPARVDCLPENAYPAEDPVVEISECRVFDEGLGYDDRQYVPFEVDGLFTQRIQSGEGYQLMHYTSLEEEIKDAAYESFCNTQE